MLLASIPVKFPIPFGNSAGVSYIRQVPTASQIGTQNGAASLTDGFPPNCFIPTASGGSWPWGADLNGLLKQTTAWAQWVQAGAPVAYDAAFSTAIGGYPKGALLWSATTFGLQWLSTADNNTTNPDTGGAGWQIYSTFPTVSTIVSGATAITGAASGTLFLVETNATQTISGGTFTAGQTVGFRVVSPNACTVTLSGGATFNGGGIASASAISMPAGSWFAVQCDAAGNFQLFTASPDILGYALLASPHFTGIPTAPTTPLGTQSTQLATTAFVNPYFLIGASYSVQQFSSGLILQTGTGSAPSGTPPLHVDAPFPVTFPNAVLSIALGGATGDPPGVSFDNTFTTRSSVRLVTNGAGGEAINYFAMGW